MTLVLNMSAIKTAKAFLLSALEGAALSESELLRVSGLSTQSRPFEFIKQI